MGAAISVNRGPDPTRHAQSPPPLTATATATAPTPQAGPADNVIQARSPPPVGRSYCRCCCQGPRREPAGARSSASAAAAAAAAGGGAVEALGYHAPAPAQAQAQAPEPRPSRRRNRSESAGSTMEQQLEVEATSRGNKRPCVVHCLSTERSEGSSVQVNEEEYAAEVVANPTTSAAAAAAVAAAAAAALTCPVCWNLLQEPSTTTCGHVFCDRCVKQAVRVSKACPNCRKKLRRSSIRRIYLPTLDVDVHPSWDWE